MSWYFIQHCAIPSIRGCFSETTLGRVQRVYTCYAPSYPHIDNFLSEGAEGGFINTPPEGVEGAGLHPSRARAHFSFVFKKRGCRGYMTPSYPQKIDPLTEEKHMLFQTRLISDPNCVQYVHRKLTLWERVKIKLEGLCADADLIYPYERVVLQTAKPAMIRIGNDLICHPDIYDLIKRSALDPTIQTIQHGRHRGMFTMYPSPKMSDWIWERESK